MIFKARNAVTGEGALVRVYGKDTDLLLDRRCGLLERQTERLCLVLFGLSLFVWAFIGLVVG